MAETSITTPVTTILAPQVHVPGQIPSVRRSKSAHGNQNSAGARLLDNFFFAHEDNVKVRTQIERGIESATSNEGYFTGVTELNAANVPSCT